MSIGPRRKTYLTRRIIWRAGRVASWPEESASFVISSVSLPQNPTGLTCPNARSTLTDRLACLRGGGGKRGTWMNGKKNPHPPTGRQGALTDRNSSRLFRGAVASPFLHLLSDFRGPRGCLWTPWRSILPSFKQRRRPPPPSPPPPPHFPPSTNATFTNVRLSLLSPTMEEQERPPRI